MPVGHNWSQGIQCFVRSSHQQHNRMLRLFAPHFNICVNIKQTHIKYIPTNSKVDLSFVFLEQVSSWFSAYIYESKIFQFSDLQTIIV